MDCARTPLGRHLPLPVGLYNPAFEHDACGTGFVAQVSGGPTHEVLALGLEALCNLAHRGAVGADAHSGDGAGVLTQLPFDLFTSLAPTVARGDLAIAMGFWPTNADERERAFAIAEASARAEGLVVQGWREVPTRPEILGDRAREARPFIAQLLVSRPAKLAPADFTLALYAARRRLESAAREAGLDEVYVCSFSERTIVYKALASAKQLASFYPDLTHPAYVTAICVFHQRYSTNTFPSWPLAQPFRLIAHNGEINTVTGNKNALAARGNNLGGAWNSTARPWLFPVVQAGGSDSSALDNALEVRFAAGQDPLLALRLMVPPAAMDNQPLYAYHAPLQEPWDGPAALVTSDGDVVAALLDRNGLRPARYAVTADGLVVLGSEAGLVDLGERTIIEMGRLGPGRMLAVDTRTAEVLHDEALTARFTAQRPYGELVAARTLEAHGGSGALALLPDPLELARLQLAFGYTREDVVQLLGTMAATGKEPIGSMGDDTPLAAFSEKSRPITHYFKQRFAQVTNPPIDPLRERLVTSLRTEVGARRGLLDEGGKSAPLLGLPSPILTDAEFAWLRSAEASQHLGQPSTTLVITWEPAGGETALAASLQGLGEAAVSAVSTGTVILVLSDRHSPSAERAPIPSLLALAAVERALANADLLSHCSVIFEVGDVRDDHHIALLLGHGAAAVNPYLAFASAARLAADGQVANCDAAAALANVKAALELGLIKILAKMGVCTIASYRGARLFEAIGLGRGVTQTYFPLTTARLGGVELDVLAAELAKTQAAALEGSTLTEMGLYRYRVGGEHHQYNPAVFKAMHTVGKAGKPEDFQTLAELVANRPRASIRDLLGFKAAPTPVSLDEVEPASTIVKRFVASAMSLGALSAEAHACIAIAMNRLGARSNSGEGGEDPVRAKPMANGDSSHSSIKQIAAGRFGVTPFYLVGASEIEIKMAQGAKPGEGGQLPGPKVTAEIARLRYATPGVPLISPPPHHDIYSIEDLAQLIHDLREVNPLAAIAVKLVAEAGVGTVAAGVAKAHADIVHISGHDGGTGASPLGSIKHVGLPWELGLAETQQVLVLNGLRGRVRLRVDGGFKTGRDVVAGALLGADEYAFGTALVVAAGCILARTCHQNNCPVGIATQEPALRARFKGDPARIVNYLLALAQDVRVLLAGLGLRSLAEAIGRVDLLEQRVPPAKAAGLDLSPLLVNADPTPGSARSFLAAPERHRAVTPDDQVLGALPGLPVGARYSATWPISNTQRAVGARLAGAIALEHGDHGFGGDIDLTFEGTAGQSFGAFCLDGVSLTLVGVANDYVGKGMAGGRIVIRPGSHMPLQAVLLGNTVLYGATGGALYVAGAAGERFAVRNSGATAVVEGVGDHGCEYMTRGQVLVLGPCGRNFGAGMTGGTAYVLDNQGDFATRVNHETVELERPTSQDEDAILALLRTHLALTQSPVASDLLANWESHRACFWVVSGVAAAAKVTPLPERQAQQALPEAL